MKNASAKLQSVSSKTQIYDFVGSAFSPRGFLSSLLGSLSDVKVLLTMTQSRFVKRHKLFKVVLPSMEKKLKEKRKIKTCSAHAFTGLQIWSL